MDTKVHLKIADLIIRLESKFPLKKLNKEEQEVLFSERYKNFIYSGNSHPDILIKIKIVPRLPKIIERKTIFITHHFQDGEENWRLLKVGNYYIYSSPLKDKLIWARINKGFDNITAYLVPDKNNNWAWKYEDIVYDFLQVVLISYFAQRKKGVFAHAVGIKDVNKAGLIFIGKSGAGKSTIARIWYSRSKAIILNDDRIIIRKNKGGFFIYGSPWHGAFSDYLASRIESAQLKKIMFIYHSKKNKVSSVSGRHAFVSLYPAMFPPFWDKGFLDNASSLFQELIKCVPCYKMGFRNDEKVISFVRKIH